MILTRNDIWFLGRRYNEGAFISVFEVTSLVRAQLSVDNKAGELLCTTRGSVVWFIRLFRDKESGSLDNTTSSLFE